MGFNMEMPKGSYQTTIGMVQISRNAIPSKHYTDRNGIHAPGHIMMTSSNGNIFRITGHLCGEFIGPGEFPAQRPVTRSFGGFFYLCLNKRLSKQSRGWWFETVSRPLWRQRNVIFWYTESLSFHLFVTVNSWLKVETNSQIIIPFIANNHDYRTNHWHSNCWLIYLFLVVT